MNTLEAKQFFSRIAIEHFVFNAILQQYDPPYVYLLIISIDEYLFKNANPVTMRLDGYEAINIDQNDLLSFNKCVNFVETERL